MACVLGLDIGTTSTIGVLIRPPDQTIALASRPVALRSDHVGWAEEDPEEWWANVGEIVRELTRSSGVSPAEIAAVGVTGMLPAVVLLNSAGRLLRPSIQQSDARCRAEVAELRTEIDEKAFLAKAGNGINQQLVIAKLRWIERHEPAVFARIATVFGSYDYINWRLTGERAIEQNWALEAGFVDFKSQAIDDALVALAHIPRAALPRKVASHDILGVVSDRGAAESGLEAGTRVIGGAADHIASALGAGVVSAGDVLLKFGGSVDILTATDHAEPDPRLFLDYHLRPGLFVPNGCMSTGGSALNWFARHFAGGETQAAEKAGVSIHQWLDRLAEQRPAGSDGLVITPYFLGEKTPIHDANARATFDGLTLSHDIGHSLEGPARGLCLCDRASCRGHERDRLQDRALHCFRRRIYEPRLDADRRRRLAATGSKAGRTPRLLRRRRLDGGDRRQSRLRLVCDFRLRASLRPDRASARGRGDLSPRLSPLPRDLSRPCGTHGVMSVFRAVAWDIDGTLIDSEGLHQRSLIETGAEFGVDLSDLPDEAFRGIHMRDVWTALKPRFPNTVDRNTWIAAIERFYVAHAPSLSAIPGAVEAVRALAAKGVAQACVSNSGRSIVDANLDVLGIRRLMAFSISLEDVSRGKPDPEPYREAARRLAIRPAAIVAVEDSGAGARSARSAGLYVMGYAPDRDAIVGSDRSIAKLMEVLSLFDS